jgi:hypothetical protein
MNNSRKTEFTAFSLDLGSGPGFEKRLRGGKKSPKCLLLVARPTDLRLFTLKAWTVAK